jgi:hypothetical protein
VWPKKITGCGSAPKDRVASKAEKMYASSSIADPWQIAIFGQLARPTGSERCRGGAQTAEVHAAASRA